MGKEAEGESVMKFQFQVDFRPVDLLCDAKGVYGIGVVVPELESQIFPESYRKPLILRADVLKDTATFPNEYRETALQTLGNRKWCDGYEWELHALMAHQALERNPRCQTLCEIEHITSR
jgi:hypothetical protein